MQCGRCHIAIVPVRPEICWWCQRPLCGDCWKFFGHCGHEEADQAHAAYREKYDALDKERTMETATKPVCQLTGTDSNVFALAGRVSRALKKAGHDEKTKEMYERLIDCASYDAALRLFREYVEVR